ncbi:MAG: hypothetical protein ACRDP6_14575 [Actinoallomurus sp.]
MPGKSSNINITEDSSMDRVKARELSKLLVLAPPWASCIFVVILGAVFHHLWGQPGRAAWAVIGETVCTMLLGGLTWVLSHSRNPLFKAHTTATSLCAGAWVTAATISGVHWSGRTGYFAILGGVFFSLTWNLRHVIRNVTGDGNGDALNDVFSKVRERFGFGGTELHATNATEHKIEAKAALEAQAGEKTVDDLQKKLRHAEAAMNFPPGSLTAVPDPDRADQALVTLIDPRKMREPIPWPGPSRPGASIAEPLRPGLWADFDPVEYTILNHHLQIMGMTGSAKSLGAGWNMLAEAITRHDVAVFVGDITKGEQTMGPLRPALHRFETSEAGVKDMLANLQREVKGRTDFLAAKGLTAWEEGCGLQYWLVWLEEFPDIAEILTEKQMKKFLSLVKALRSAGGTIVISLQRSDWTQMPTIARGQLAFWCFGVQTEKDASFGLSPAQLKAGAVPELWGNKQPGMAYLDGPPIPEERLALAARMYLWTQAEMVEHAKAWPAAEKGMDEFTARVVAGTSAVRPAADDEPEDAPEDDKEPEDAEETEGSAVKEHQKTPDPNPDIKAGIDDEIEDDPAEADWKFEKSDQKMTPEEARSLLLAQLEAWANEGRESFTMADLMPTLERTGMTRQWALKLLKILIADDAIERDEETRGRYLLKIPATA